MSHFRQTARAPFASLLLHGLVLAAALLAWRWAPRPAPLRLPGTADGKRLMLSYSLGGRPAAQAPAVKPSRPQAEVAVPAAAPAPTTPAANALDQGSGAAGESALGQGDINIATVQQHPRPEPDLSSLPHGGGGQVVMDAVIDEQGRISQLTLVHGLGDGIDETVLATVRGWTFRPATKAGKPVSSEQEILLYYERG